MGLFDQFINKTPNKSISELDAELDQVERERLKKKGQKRLEAKKRQKKNELRKKKFKQTKAGGIFDAVASTLDAAAEAAENQDVARTNQSLSNQLELIDGDGRRDNRKAARQAGAVKTGRGDLEGEVEVTGTLELEDQTNGNNNKKRQDPFDFGFDEDDRGFI